MPSGYIMRDKDHEDKDEEKKKNGNGHHSNGNGDGSGESNGGSNGGGDGGGGVAEGWSAKYKKSIDCNNPKGFSQRAHCRGRKKMNEAKNGDHEVAMAQSQLAKAERNIAKLRKALGKKEKDIPAWMQAKITDTAHDTDAAAGYVDKIDEARKQGEGKRSKPSDYGKEDTATPRGRNVQRGRLNRNDAYNRAKREERKKEAQERARERAERRIDELIGSEEDRKYAKQKRKERGIEESRDGKSAKDKDYSLHDWFKGGGWVQAGGKYDGKPCAKQPGQKTKPFCRDADDRASMTKKERERRAKKKRREDPNPNRKGKAKMVTKEEFVNEKKDACYHKVKSRYSVWPSAYASGALVKCRKVGAKNWGNKTKKESYDYSNWRDEFKATEFEFIDIVKTEPMKGLSEAKSTFDKLKEVSKQLKGASKMHAKQSKVVAKCADELDEAKKCWPGYEKKGTKKMFGKTYNNCVKKEGFSDWRSELDLQEKKMKNCGCGQNPCKTYGKQEVKEDWQKVNRGDNTDGMSQKAVNAYKRENPGSKLQTAVTEKKPKGKRAKRRKSFCARSNGQRKMHNIDCSKTPEKKICKARKRWNC